MFLVLKMACISALSPELIGIVCEHLRKPPRRSGAALSHAWYRAWNRAGDDLVGRGPVLDGDFFRWSYGMLPHTTCDRAGWCRMPADTAARTRTQKQDEARVKGAALRVLARRPQGVVSCISPARAEFELAVARGLGVTDLVLGPECLTKHGVGDLLRGFPNLVWLDLDGQCDVEVPGYMADLAAALAGLPRLTHLDLSRNAIGLRDTVAVLKLPKLRGLKELVLDDNPLVWLPDGARDLADALDALPRLLRLDLQNIGLFINPLPVLEAIGRQGAIKSLDLVGHHVGGVPGAARVLGEVLGRLTELKMLRLTTDTVNEGDLEPRAATVAALQTLRIGRSPASTLRWVALGSATMVRLAVTNVDLRARGAEFATAVSVLTGLRHLHMGGCDFEKPNDLVCLFTGLPAEMRELDLSGTEALAPEWRAEVAPAIARLTNLDTLTLARCLMGGSDPAPLIAMIRALPSLTVLDVSANGMYCPPPALMDAIGALSLCELDLSSNPLVAGVGGAVPPTIVDLYLGSTGVTMTDTTRIASSCPLIEYVRLDGCDQTVQYPLRHLM